MWTAILVLSQLLLTTGLIAMGTGKEDDNIAAVIIGVVVDALAIVSYNITGRGRIIIYGGRE